MLAKYEEITAREKAEKDAAEKAVHEKVEKEAAERAAREKAERESAEKARLEKIERDRLKKSTKTKKRHKQGSKRILMFEDDYESMKNLAIYMEEQLEWEVELTSDKDLLNRLSWERFDLILMDIMIHPVSLDANGLETQNVRYDNVSWQHTGFEFIRRLRKGEYNLEGQGTPSDVPVIIMSAIVDHGAIDKLMEDGVQIEGSIEKPFRLQELTNLMQSLLQESATKVRNATS